MRAIIAASIFVACLLPAACGGMLDDACTRRPDAEVCSE